MWHALGIFIILVAIAYGGSCYCEHCNNRDK